MYIKDEHRSYHVHYRFAFTDPEKVCNTTFDGVSCWRSTGAGHLSVISCFSELNGVFYDPSRQLRPLVSQIMSLLITVYDDRERVAFVSLERHVGREG